MYRLQIITGSTRPDRPEGLLVSARRPAALSRNPEIKAPMHPAHGIDRIYALDT